MSRAARVAGWLGAGLLGLLGVALAGALGGLVWLQSEAGERQIARWINEAFASSLATGAVRVGEVDLRWSRLVLTDLRVDGAHHEDVLVVPRVDAALDLPALLRKTVHLPSLVVRAPRLRAPGGALDLPTLAESEEPTEETTYLPVGWTLVIDEARIVDGRSDDLAVRDLDARMALLAAHETVDVRRASASWAQDRAAIALGASLRLVADDLERLSVAVDAEGARGELWGSVRSALGDGPKGLDLRARGRASAEARRALAAALDQALPEALASAPPVWASADIGGVLAEPRVELTAGWGEGRALTARIDGTEGGADFRAEIPELAALAPLDAGRAGIDGAVAFADDGAARGHATLTVSGLAAGDVRLADVTAPFDFGWAADGPARVTGAVDARGVRTSAEAALGRVTGTFGATVGDAVTGHAELTTARLQVGDLPLRGFVRVEASPERVTARARLVDRRDPSRRITLDGRYALESGRVVVSDLTLRPTEDVAWRNVGPVTAVIGDGEVRDLALHLRSDSGRVRVDAPRLARGEVDLRADVDVELGPISAALAALAPDLAPPVSGRLTGDAEISVGDGAPPAVVARLEGARITVADQLDDVSFTLDARVRDDVLHANADLRGARSTLATLSGTVPLRPGLTEIACGGAGALTLAVPDTSWLAVSERLPALPALPAGVTLGAMRGALRATGDPCDPSVTLTATLAPEVGGERIDVDVALRDDPRLDTLTGDITAGGWGTATVSAAHDELLALLQAEDPVAEVGPWTVAAVVTGVPAAVAMEDASGAWFGQARISGDGGSARATVGHLGWANGTVEGLPVEEAYLTWGTVAGRIVTDGVARVGGSALVAQAEVGLEALQERGLEAPIAVRVPTGAVPLALAEPLSGGAVIDASGIVRLEGTIGGTLSSPDADLTLAIRDGALTVAETGVRYDGITVTGRAEGDTLVIDQGRMRSRPRYGRYALLDRRSTDLRVSGTVTLGEDRSVRPDLRIALDRFWAMNTDTAQLQATGNLRITGEVGDLSVTGRIDVDEGRFTLEPHQFLPPAAEQLHDDIVFEDGPPDILRDDEPRSASPLESVTVDVTVDVRRGITLDATVPLVDETPLPLGGATDVELASEVDGRVRVRQGGADTDVRGRLDAEGLVRLFGAQFEIVEGTIAFAGSDYTSPNLEFVVERPTQTYGTVTARITGTPSALQVTDLRSDAYEDPSDVMSILLFGKPLSELGSGQSAAGAEMVQAALINAAGAELEDAIGVELVDRVDYTPGAGLSLGWAIGPDGFFTVTLHPTAEDDENRTEASLTWLLGRSVQVEVQSGDAAVTSGWLSWERRF